jgi:hypothetical protein
MLEGDCNGKVKTAGGSYVGIVVVISRLLGLLTKQNVLVFHKMKTFHNLAMEVAPVAKITGRKALTRQQWYAHRPSEETFVAP